MLVLTVLAAAVSSFSLCLIPLTSGMEEGKGDAVGYLIAVAFWLGWILMLAATFLTGKCLRRCSESLAMKGADGGQRLPGIIRFSLNRKHLFLYAVTLLGLVLCVTNILLGYIPEPLMFPILSVTILSFAAHCVADGKYYKVYQQIKEIVK